MAVKAGQILHLANDSFVIDRIQSVAANVNVPKDRVYELGNYYSLGYVRDIPDLGFTVESYDVTWELPAILNGITLGTVPAAPNNFLDPAAAVPLDITSPFKTKRSLDASTGISESVRGVAMPYLFLESIGMRFGVTALSSITYGFRGDSIYYSPGTPLTNTNTGDGIVTLWNFKDGGTNTTALPYNENGVDKYAMSVTLIESDGSYRRLLLGTDYTETSAGITVSPAIAATQKLRVTFAADPGGATGSQSWDEEGAGDIHSPVTATTPAALRGRFIELYVNGTKFLRVQEASIDWRVNLERDEEFNNPRVVDMTYADTPEATGSFTVKARNPQELVEAIQDACNVAAGKVVGPIYDSTAAVPMEIRLKDPVNGTTISSVYFDKVTFDIPGYDQRVASNNLFTLNFYSENGKMLLYKGNGPTV